MNVTVADDFGEEYVARLRHSFPRARITPAYGAAEQLALAPEVEVQFGLIDRPTFLSARRLKWFHFVGIGFDSVLCAIPEFPASGLLMTNTRGTHVIPMAEYAVGMMIALGHRLRESLDDQRARRWETAKYRGHILKLAGSTLGILACGDLGRAVAARAAALDMRVLAVDLEPRPAPGVEQVWGLERFDEMLSLSDWLVITAPRTAASANMIAARELQLLRPGAHVVVISRGGILDEDALLASLDAGHLAGAAIDATAEEPPPADSGLWDHPLVYLTAHVSAETRQLVERRGDVLHDKLGRYLTGAAAALRLRPGARLLRRR